MKPHRKIYLAFLILLSISVFSCDEGNDPVPQNDSPMDMADGSNDDSTGGMDSNTDAVLAPDFSLTGINNQIVSLSQHTNQVVVLFFLGNTCPSCKAIAPDVQSKLVDAYIGRSDYTLIGIDQWDGSKSSLEGFRSSTGTSFPLLLKGSSVAKDYNTTYDRLIVIDKNGYIRFKGTRNVSSDINAAISVVDE